jgi:ATP-binding protein involved in chromosome partitioning
MEQNSQSMELRIAIPTAGGVLAGHFGHCEHFTMFDVRESRIVQKTEIRTPPHEPGAIPLWLNQQGVGVIIAGGMGARAQQFFTRFGIQVLVGAPSIETEELARRFLDGTLQTAGNTCDSEHHGGGGGGGCGEHKGRGHGGRGAGESGDSAG